MPLNSAVSSALQKTVDEYGYEGQQEKTDKPKDEWEKQDEETVITTHFPLDIGGWCFVCSRGQWNF